MMKTEVNAGTADSDELEALFDSIAAAGRKEAQHAPDGPAQPAEQVVVQIGHLTRKLHDTLHQLGFDKVLQDATKAMPDTRDRLAYVATMTEQAAVRALTAIETAKPIQDRLRAEASALSLDWDRVFSRELGIGEFKGLAERTRGFLAGVPVQAEATNAQLMDIMMAQDFQDLTGQVIKKITEMARDMEGQLLQLLLENSPPERREAAQSLGLLNGPVIDGKASCDVVTNQSQVDDLLESLGF